MFSYSLTNLVMGNSNQSKPQIGNGCTILHYTDRHAATIIEISGNGKSITVQEDIVTRIDKNGMSESQAYEYSTNPNGVKIIFTLRKNGAWVKKGNAMKNGLRVAIGTRNHYYDYSF